MSKKPSHTALIIVDFINPFDFPGAEKLAPRAIAAATQTARLKQRAKACQVPCIYVNDNFGHWTSEFSALARDCLNRSGASAAIAELLQPSVVDLAVLKPRHSGFYGTPLEFLLEELRISRLIITGITADNCIFATAQDAYVRKFELWVPKDCVAAISKAHETSSLAHMARTLKADIKPARNSKAL